MRPLFPRLRLGFLNLIAHPTYYVCLCVTGTVSDVYKNKFLENWTAITNLRKPIIAAVSGYAVRSLLLLPVHFLTLNHFRPRISAGWWL